MPTIKASLPFASGTSDYDFRNENSGKFPSYLLKSFFLSELLHLFRTTSEAQAEILTADDQNKSLKPMSSN